MKFCSAASFAPSTLWSTARTRIGYRPLASGDDSISAMRRSAFPQYSPPRASTPGDGTVTFGCFALIDPSHAESWLDDCVPLQGICRRSSALLPSASTSFAMLTVPRHCDWSFRPRKMSPDAVTETVVIVG